MWTLAPLTQIRCPRLQQPHSWIYSPKEFSLWPRGDLGWFTAVLQCQHRVSWKEGSLHCEKPQCFFFTFYWNIVALRCVLLSALQQSESAKGIHIFPQPQKGTKLCHLQRCGWTYRMSFRVKEVRQTKTIVSCASQKGWKICQLNNDETLSCHLEFSYSRKELS